MPEPHPTTTPPTFESLSDLAGWLAEAGVTRIDLYPLHSTPPDQPRTLFARQTDLPGELHRSIPCRLIARAPLNPHSAGGEHTWAFHITPGQIDLAAP